jgi:hypothetical protein
MNILKWLDGLYILIIIDYILCIIHPHESLEYSILYKRVFQNVHMATHFSEGNI